MITIRDVTVNEIPFLIDQNSLFILDYRALGESLEYEIPAMWKYENLAPWILRDQKILVNENFHLLKYLNDNSLFSIPCGTKAKLSILERAEGEGVLKDIAFKHIFAFIPHPSFDKFALDKNKTLSYSYKDFLILNDKLTQKHLVTDTPTWKVIHNKKELEKINNKEDFYVKRALGSGGFTVFKLSDIAEDNKFEELLGENEGLWYLEEKVDGSSMSIQLFKDKQDVVIFGITKQYIKDGKEFFGAEILPLSLLTEDSFLKKKLLLVVDELTKGLLGSYQGFFGIDFIYNEEQQIFAFLEGNIRLTAMTIPTLLYNQSKDYKIFKEDVEKKEVVKNSLILGYDSIYDGYDVLSLK